MGQDVIIKNTVTMGDVLVIDTDRSFTGQDGHTITPETERRGVPGKLADRLFALDIGIDYMFVLQNTVTVRRNGGWDSESADEVTEIAGSFLRYYPDEPQEVGAADGDPEGGGAGDDTADEEE
jgi:hypothetical protein